MSHGPPSAVPIASLTKMMTAYVILQDHPLGPGQSGPDIRIDSTDIDITYNDELNDETMVPVVHGELLTEKQALDGLLVHSACNLAYALARWDSGSVSAFVTKMNATARRLGLDATSYAGPAGFSPASVSTPADLVKLATVAMSIPAFAQIVDHPSVTLPVAGTLYNYVSAIGQDGVIGIKSGFNYQSQGCVVLAATRYVDGKPVLLIAAVTGQGGM
ncbi:peptidase S11 D-alanyl-D-alanine carboxypeptidase 1, partial [mine drainage metagenome]